MWYRKGLFILVLLMAGMFIISCGVGSGRSEIRIVSFNINNSIGTDNIYDYTRAARAIGSMRPEFVVIQEVDSGSVYSQGRHVLKEIAEINEMFYLFVPVCEYSNGIGASGSGILSKEEAIRSWSMVLPGDEYTPGSLFIAEFEKFYLMNLQLSRDVNSQIESISVIDEVATELTEKPVILAGSVYATLESQIMRGVLKNWSIMSDPTQQTYPAQDLTYCFDYIFSYKNNPIDIVLDGGALYDEFSPDTKISSFGDQQKDIRDELARGYIDLAIQTGKITENDIRVLQIKKEKSSGSDVKVYASDHVPVYVDILL